MERTRPRRAAATAGASVMAKQAEDLALSDGDYENTYDRATIAEPRHGTIREARGGCGSSKWSLKRRLRRPSAAARIKRVRTPIQ